MTKCVYVLVIQLCPTLRDPMIHSSPGSSVYRILQARVLEWVAISFFISHLEKQHNNISVSQKV